MSFWDLDDKAQLALLMAGLVGTTTAAGCDRRVDDPVPSDAMADARDSLVADMVPPDAKPDIVMSDPPPPDAKPDQPPVVDPPPPDAKVDVMVSDMAPPDAKADVMVSDMAPPDAKPPDTPPVADPLPPDASAPYSSTPRRSTPRARRALPLSRDFRTRVKAVTSPDHVQLTAVTRGMGNPALRHTWTISGGTLDRTDRANVSWTPPTTPGKHMAQVVVRDGRGSLAVDVYLHEVK